MRCGLRSNFRQIRPDRGLRQPAAPGHRGPRPVRRVPGQLLQGRRDDLLDLVQQDGRRPAGALLVVQAAQPARRRTGPATAPRCARWSAVPQPRPCSRCPPRRPARSSPAAPAPAPSSPPRPPGQLIPLGARQHEVRLPPPWAPGVREPGRPRHREPRAPLPHRLNGKPQLSSHPGIALGRDRAGQHDPGPLLQAAIPGTRQPLKLSPVLTRQRQRRNSKRHNISIEINVQYFRRVT